jgi:tRNA1Val (adenine37-N6)-methyltransferase
MKVTTDGCLFGAWVAKQLSEEHFGAGAMLDIGTGTGVLTLMIAQKNPQLVIDAIEIDDSAFVQASENISKAGFKNEIRICRGDIRHETFGKEYEVIISNPPFYENEIKSASNQRNFAHHDEGLLLQDLLPIIKERLSKNGVFYLLLPYKRKNEIDSLFRKYQLYSSKKISVRQSTRHDYFRVLIEGKLDEQSSPIEYDLSICDDAGNYTLEFVTLLKDYYLYL